MYRAALSAPGCPVPRVSTFIRADASRSDLESEGAGFAAAPDCRAIAVGVASDSASSRITNRLRQKGEGFMNQFLQVRNFGGSPRVSAGEYLRPLLRSGYCRTLSSKSPIARNLS